MYDKEFNRYNVVVFKKTILNEYHKDKTEEFDSIEKAIEFGKNEIEKGNKIRIEEVSNIINWL